MSQTWGRGSTRKSRTNRAIVLAREPYCYLRLPGCTLVATVDEHVVGRAAGGTDDLTNRRGACVNCNDRKRVAEAQAGKKTRRRAPERHPGLI